MNGIPVRGTGLAMLWLAALWPCQATASGQDPEALEEQIEEAMIELEDEGLDEAELERWAEDELDELTLGRLQRRADSAERRAARAAWLPRLSLSVQLGLPRAAAAGRDSTALPASVGAATAPDDADGSQRVGLRWRITLRLVWDLPDAGRSYRRPMTAPAPMRPMHREQAAEGGAR